MQVASNQRADSHRHSDTLDSFARQALGILELATAAADDSSWRGRGHSSKTASWIAQLIAGAHCGLHSYPGDRAVSGHADRGTSNVTGSRADGGCSSDARACAVGRGLDLRIDLRVALPDGKLSLRFGKVVWNVATHMGLFRLIQSNLMVLSHLVFTLRDVILVPFAGPVQKDQRSCQWGCDRTLPVCDRTLPVCDRALPGFASGR